jgi:hypothetical protein
MIQKRQADSELSGGTEHAAATRRAEWFQGGDLEGETLAAVRAACRKCHLPLPTACLASSLSKSPARNDSSQIISSSSNAVMPLPPPFSDPEAEFMQREIKSRVESLREHQKPPAKGNPSTDTNFLEFGEKRARLGESLFSYHEI